jgi:hypothetical protein
MGSPAKGLTPVQGPHSIKYVKWYLDCTQEVLKMRCLPVGAALPCPFKDGLPFVEVKATDFGAVVCFPHVKTLKGTMFQVGTLLCLLTYGA